MRRIISRSALKSISLLRGGYNRIPKKSYSSLNSFNSKMMLNRFGIRKNINNITRINHSQYKYKGVRLYSSSNNEADILNSITRSVDSLNVDDDNDDGKIEVFRALADLDIYNIRLENTSSLVILGQQSSGKSSLVESICGVDILPKENDMYMSTMKPFHITTLNSKVFKIKVGEKTFYDEKSAREEATRLNSNSYVETVNIVISKPGLYNIRIQDMPGLYHSNKHDDSLPDKIYRLNEKYIQNPNTIPVLVSSVTSDMATNQGYKLLDDYSRRAMDALTIDLTTNQGYKLLKDYLRRRAIGVLTKVDLITNHKTDLIVNILRGKSYNLGFPYVALVLRNGMEVERGMTVDEKIPFEEQFFEKNPRFRPCGMKFFRKLIADVQYDTIKDEIPKIIDSIKKEKLNLQQAKTFLETLRIDPNLAVKLKELVEKLVDSSSERSKFEKSLKEEFSDYINSYINELLEPADYYEPVFSDKPIDSDIYRYHKLFKTNISSLEANKFKEMFGYGSRAPIIVNTATLQREYKKECDLACTLPLYDIYEDDPSNDRKSQTDKYLRRFFSNMLSEDRIQETLYQITEKKILEYLHDDPDCNELTKKFSNYFIKEIGRFAFDNLIKFSITAMIKKEQRPDISLVEMARQFDQMYIKFKGGILNVFSKKNKKIKVEAYSEHWNVAYLRTVATKISEDAYRFMAVNLVDRIVEESLKMSIDILNVDNALKEREKIREKILKLDQLKATLRKHHSPNNILI